MKNYKQIREEYAEKDKQIRAKWEKLIRIWGAVEGALMCTLSATIGSIIVYLIIPEFREKCVGNEAILGWMFAIELSLFLSVRVYNCYLIDKKYDEIHANIDAKYTALAEDDLQLIKDLEDN